MTAAEHLAAAIAALDADRAAVDGRGPVGTELAAALRDIAGTARSAASRLARVNDRLVRADL